MNIIVYGVGHSGTSILTKMLVELGFSVGKNMDEYHFEDIDARNINEAILSKEMDNDTAKIKIKEFLVNYPQLFVLKDPRFIWTLPIWEEVIQELNIPVFLLSIEKEASKILKSHQKRNEKVTLEQIESKITIANNNYLNSSLTKYKFEFSQLIKAVSLFNNPEKKSIDTSAFTHLKLFITKLLRKK